MHDETVVATVHLCDALGLWFQFLTGDNHHIRSGHTVDVLVCNGLKTADFIECGIRVESHVLRPFLVVARCECLHCGAIFLVEVGILVFHRRSLVVDIPHHDAIVWLGNLDAVGVGEFVEAHAHLSVLGILKIVVVRECDGKPVEACPFHHQFRWHINIEFQFALVAKHRWGDGCRWVGGVVVNQCALAVADR